MHISNSVKYVPMNDFITYLQTRYDCHKFKCKPFPPQQAQSHSHCQQSIQEVNDLVCHLADIGESLAQQEGPLTQVVHKFKDLDLFKVKESKKRKRVTDQSLSLH